MKKELLTQSLLKEYLKKKNLRDLREIATASFYWLLIIIVFGIAFYFVLTGIFKLNFIISVVISIIPFFVFNMIVFYKLYYVLHRAVMIAKGRFTVVKDKVSGLGYDETPRTFDTYFFRASRNRTENAIYFCAHDRYVVKQDSIIVPDWFESEFAMFRRTSAGDIMNLIVFDDEKEKVIAAYHSGTYEIDKSIKVAKDVVALKSDI